MDFTNSPIDVNSYVAKYMDEMGCSFEQACEDLEIDETQLSSEKDEDEIY